MPKEYDMVVELDLDELKRDIQVALDTKNFTVADKLISVYDMIETLTIPDKRDVDFRRSEAVFNRSSAAKSVTGHRIGYKSKKIIKWNKENVDALIFSIVECGESFDDYRKISGNTEASDTALRTRVWKSGYIKLEDGSYELKGK